MIAELLAAVMLPQVAPAAAAPKTPLWQTLNRGMSGEEAAAALRAIPGIKGVTVKVAKDGSAKLSIAYTKMGVEVVDIRRTIEPVFDRSGLKAVGLVSTPCNSLAEAKFDILKGLLEEKYGKYVEQREKTPENVVTAIRASFSDTPTRIMIRYEPQERPVEMIPTGNAFADLVVSIHNSQVHEAVSACPTDLGRKVKLQVIYLSNDEATTADEIDASQQSAKKAADKSKL